MELCREASRLLDIYLRELSAFHDERDRCSLSLVGYLAETPIRSRQAALEKALQARRRYWNHIESHGCRDHGSGEPLPLSAKTVIP